MESKAIKVALVQASPVWFDLDGTIEKIEHLLLSASREKAELVVFPEAFIPCYPRGLGFGTVVGNRSEAGRALWEKYWKHALDLESPAALRIAAVIKAAHVYCAIGVTEREKSTGTLYCSLLIYAPDGTLLGKHRKLKPTGAERIIWGEGDGTTLKVYDTAIGRMGGLICWENYMPLARMALYQQKVELYLAPTADQRPGWLASMQHIALEGRCFVLACNQFVNKTDYPKDLQSELVGKEEILCKGGTVVISPLGEILAGPVYDQERILYAELDMDQIIRAKMDFDVIGHYHRPDVFEYQYLKGKN